MTRGSELANILFVAGILLLIVIFAIGVISLQLCFNALYRRRAAQAASQSPPPWRRRGAPAAAAYRAAACPEEECAVCLAGLEDGEEVWLMPCCGHGFHALCVDTWLASHATCPLCRIAVARPGMAPEPAASSFSRPVPSVSDQGVVTVATGRDMIAIDIPELAVPHGDHPK